MFQTWKPRDDGCMTVKDVIERNTGLTEAELKSPVGFNSPITNLRAMGMELMTAKGPVTIFADYDADGITSAVILTWALRHIGITPTVMFPKRKTGYGIQEADVDKIDSGIILTVDNGISALAAIKKAKLKGLRVFVLDHHLPGEELPDADIIVDPHMCRRGDFEDWCGAGLSYRLAKEIVTDKRLLQRLVQYAAIGTIADVVPLKKDNRSIVKEGLDAINRCPDPAIKLLVLKAEISCVDEVSVGFKIGPMINAPGRVKDDAEMVYNFFMTGDHELADTIYDLNEERKKLVSQAVMRAKNILSEGCKWSERPMVVYDEKAPDGIVGIVAGKLCEEFRTPVIVLTKGEDGLAKGSARSTPEINIKELLDKAASYLERYGGHPGAAGLAIMEEKIDDFTAFINEEVKDVPRYNSERFYDLEVNAEDIPNIMAELKGYAPFGAGNPKPMFLIKGFELVPRMGVFYKTLGSEDNHLRLNGKGMTGIAFDMATKYMSIGTPKMLNLVGCIGENKFAGRSEIQVEISDLESANVQKEKSALQERLEQKLKLF